MIIADLEQLSEQLKMNSAWEQGVESLHREESGCADGVIPIDGDQVYSVLPSYTTKIPQESVLFEGQR